ncbi:MAG: MBL fold metallo-hydrolase [Actinomycetes bacterium]
MSSTATVNVLCDGYADERVAGTVSLVRDGEAIVVVDPGMVSHRSVILDPLSALGIAPDDVTDVVFSHHHPDHTLHAALFPVARFHDHWAIYHADEWIDRPADGYQLSASVALMATPGHTNEDISTVVTTDAGIVVMTHVWWNAEGPQEDPLCVDAQQLHASRAAVLDLAPILVIPGHGPAFRPGPATPR